MSVNCSVVDANELPILGFVRAAVVRPPARMASLAEDPPRPAVHPPPLHPLVLLPNLKQRTASDVGEEVQAARAPRGALVRRRRGHGTGPTATTLDPPPRWGERICEARVREELLNGRRKKL